MTLARHTGPGDERGLALVAVLTTTVVLALLAAAAVAYGVGSQNVSRHDQDWNAALAAAEAGIDDYLLRLNENGNYWEYDAGNPPPDGNAAFTDWVAVPGGGTESEFRYDVDASNIANDGRVRITATGRVRSTERTVEATLRRRSFLDYLYFTDYETVDPALYTGSPFTAAQAQYYCAHHYYDGRHPSCININFVTGDSVNGPLHTNDAFLVCGSPAFNGDTSTSWSGAGGLLYRTNSSYGCSPNDPTFANPGDPRLLAPLAMPPSNSSIKAETEAGLGGCLYTGPTAIVLNADGTMTVDSPFSKQTNNSPCPTDGTGPLPGNGVIYVQSVPSSASDPNYTYGCPGGHPLGYPISYDITTYGCRDGDAFVEGTLDGQLTIAAENDVTITWHLEYEDGVAGDDLLGLVANNNVEVYHPVRCSNAYSYCNLTHHGGQRFTDPRIDAAILSVNHSFLVPNWNRGSSLGTLHVTGAIAQRYRGPVGTTGGTGYLKDYVYDQRLQYLSPPKFLDPVASAWEIATWAETAVPGAYA